MLHSRLPTHAVLHGSVPMVKEFTVNYNDTGVATGVALCKIQASATKPVLLEINAAITTVFNAATTNVLTVGTSAGSNDQYLGAADITEGTLGIYPATAPYRVRLEADVTLTARYTQSGTAATTGKARFIVRFTPLWD